MGKNFIDLSTPTGTTMLMNRCLLTLCLTVNLFPDTCVEATGYIFYYPDDERVSTSYNIVGTDKNGRNAYESWKFTPENAHKLTISFEGCWQVVEVWREPETQGGPYVIYTNPSQSSPSPPEGGWERCRFQNGWPVRGRVYREVIEGMVTD